MKLFVLVQIRSLSECRTADLALVGSLTCVDPQMVEEVVPFTEGLLTACFLTLKYLNISLWSRVEEFVYFIFVGLRDMLINVDCIQIECCTWDNTHQCGVWYLWEYFLNVREIPYLCGERFLNPLTTTVTLKIWKDNWGARKSGSTQVLGINAIVSKAFTSSMVSVWSMGF